LVFDRFLPYALIKSPNPVFDFDQRRTRWPRQPADVRRYSVNIMVVVVVISTVVWCLLFGTQPTAYTGLYYDIETIFYVLGFLTIGALLAADVYIVAVTVAGLHRQLGSGDWELLKLSMQPPETIFAAKLASAQIRVWRIMILELGFRLLVAIAG